MIQELTVREPRELALTPAEVVAGATIQAKLLMDIVEKTKCYQNISGKKYLQVEAWETIGAFNRTHAETESITPLTRDSETIGYQARVQLWKDGVVVGGAIMPCYFTENCCKGKEGDAKHKACMSAAQTFATSKAYRMNFSYVAILAGFQPLPAEEVTEDMVVDKTEHWCEQHQTKYFKKGKMTSYAHPVEGTEPKEWCHEPKSEPSPQAVTPAKKASKAQDKVEAPPGPEKPPEQGRDVTKLKTIEQLVKALKEDFGMSIQEMWDALGIASWNDLVIPPAEAYKQVAEKKKNLNN